MTTILVDFREKMLYTDSRMTRTKYKTNNLLRWLVLDISSKEEEIFDSFNKTWRCNRLGKDVIITGAGSLDQIEAFVKALEKGDKNPEKALKGNTVVFVIHTVPDLAVYAYSEEGCTTFIKNSDDFVTTGSGRDVLYTLKEHTAMSNEEIFKCVMKEDRGTGGEIVKIDLSGRRFDEDTY